MKILIDTDGSPENVKLFVDDSLLSCVEHFTADITKDSVNINIISAKSVSLKNGKLETIN